MCDQFLAVSGETIGKPVQRVITHFNYLLIVGNIFNFSVSIFRKKDKAHTSFLALSTGLTACE